MKTNLIKRNVWMSMLAVVIALGGVLAKERQVERSSSSVQAFYYNSVNCTNQDDTDQDDCKVSNGGDPCTVQDGARDAYNTPGATSCSNILRQP